MGKLFPASQGKPSHGFVACDATSEIFGRDVFIHDQIAEYLNIGDEISFEVALNAKGMPQAVNVLGANDWQKQMDHQPAEVDVPKPPQPQWQSRQTQQGNDHSTNTPWKQQQQQ